MSHRGPHPSDVALFARERWPELQLAARELAWLLTRGYALNAALTLVGDRHQLERRQRMALMRSVCSDQQLARRRAHEEHSVSGAELHLDGFNVLMTLEAALSGGVVLAARDGCLRDLSGIHGNYHGVEETPRAVALLGATLAGAAACTFFLDRPVSNSGRLQTLVRQAAAAAGWPWQVELHAHVDGLLRASSAIVVSADGAILDACDRWLNLNRRVVREHIPDAHIVPVWADTA